MNQYRERHRLASWALEEAKENAKKYTLPPKTILFKKVDKNGKVGVGFKDFEKGNFTPIKRKDVESLGIIIESLPEYTEFSQEYQRLLSAVRQYFSEKRSISVIELNRCKEQFMRPFYYARRNVYDEYMSSEEWQQKRKEVFNLQGIYCLDCGVEATDVHHLHYETLGDECPIEDLVPLCRSCHSKRHGMEDISI